MGLNTDFNCWDGPYSSFGQWRETICRAAGMGDLNDYVGFGGSTPWPSKSKEPLVILLNHSDCDGRITVKQLRPLANRLAELLRKTTPEGGFVEWSVEHYWVQKTQTFIRGLRRAAKAGKPVEFH